MEKIGLESESFYFSENDIIFGFEGSNINLLLKSVKIVILIFSIWRVFPESNYNSEVDELSQGP